MTRWTEADYAAHLARRGVGDICEAMSKRHGEKARQKRRQAPPSRAEGGRRRRMTEHEEQCALIRECKKRESEYPGLELIHAVPNGGQRHVAVAAKLKAEGVKSGIPDLFLPVPKDKRHGLYIELKTKGGKVSDNQRKMLRALERQGYACVVAYGWESAWAAIEEYMKSGIIATLSEVFGWGGR